jgi:NADPH2:quinone reductase
VKAVVMREHGGPEVLGLEEMAVPQPGPGEARVRIEFVGVNFIDVYGRKGQYPGALPRVLGEEAAGTVDAVGPGVGEVRPGDRVAYAMQTGAYAEFAIVRSWRLVPIPSAVATRDAAAAILQGLTAHYLASSTYVLGPSDTALVHAAAGGTGRLLVQVAKRRGARVLGTVSTREKELLAREAGADEVIRYTEVEFDAVAREHTGGKGVDVVYDSVGQVTFERSLSSLRPRGTMVLFGQSSGPVPPFDPQILNRKGSLYLTRPSLGFYIADREELLRRMGDLFRWLSTGELVLRVDKVFPLAEAGRAHEYLEGRNTTGKVLLQV